MLYVIGEGSREDIAGQLQAAGADASRIVLVDTVVEYADVQLLNMLAHRAIAPHLPRVDCLIVDPLATFESDGIRRFRIRQRLAPFHRLAQRKQRPITTYFALHPNKSRRNLARRSISCRVVGQVASKRFGRSSRPIGSGMASWS